MVKEYSTLKEFIGFAVKVMIAHTLTYFLLGVIMSNIFDYQSIFEKEIIRDFMLPYGSDNILYGPLLQPLRGLLFAFAIWPIRTIVLDKKNGWLVLWGIFIVFGILATPAAAPCSMEGMIYSKLPLWFHFIGFPELLIQTLLFSLMIYWWVRKPEKKTNEANMSKNKKIMLRLLFSIMIACFAYIGYAVGGILSAKIAGVQIDLKGPSVSMRGQLMFLFAFVVNVIAVFSLSGKSLYGKIPFFWFFMIFWIIDIIAPLFYQSIFAHVMPIHLGLVLGFFPAVIITISFYMNRKNFMRVLE